MSSSRVRDLGIAVGLLLALLCPAEKAVADSPLHFKAGVSSARNERMGSPGLSLGGSLALTRWAPSAHIAFIPQLEFFFARRTTSISADSARHDNYAMDSIELPFVLRSELTIGNRTIHAMAGGYGSLLVQAQQTVDGRMHRVDPKRPVDVGWLVGGGVELGSFRWGKLYLETRYQRGYRALVAHGNQHEAFSLLLGYSMASDAAFKANGSGLLHTPNQRLSLKGGPIATRLRSPESQTPTYSSGYSFGGAFSPTRFGSRLALVPQLELFLVHRSAQDGLPEDGSMALDYVDITMLLRGEVNVSGRAIYGMGGVYGSMLLRAQRDHDGAITNMRNMVSPVDAGWIAGGGIELASTARAKLSIELRYQRGFHDIYRAHTSEVTQQSISCLFGITYGSRSGPSSALDVPEGSTDPEPSLLHSASSHSNAKKAPSPKKVSVSFGHTNYRWIELMRFAKIERGEREGKPGAKEYGYWVTYKVAGHKKLKPLFWARKDIDFEGQNPSYSEIKEPFNHDILIYPTKLTRKSLPKVYPYILQIEQAYAKQANGAISAMQGFVVVAGLGGAKPTLRPTGPVPRTIVPATQTAATRASTIAGRWVKVNESMSARAAAYQARFGRPGHAYVVNGVKFDGVKKGVLLEAKGPGYANFVKNGVFQQWFLKKGGKQLLSQARRQIRAANGHPMQWHFAEKSAADATRALFIFEDITGIRIIFTP